MIIFYFLNLSQLLLQFDPVQTVAVCVAIWASAKLPPVGVPAAAAKTLAYYWHHLARFYWLPYYDGD